MVTKEQLIEALQKVRNPIIQKDIYSAGMIKVASVCDNVAKIEVELSPQDEAIREKLESDIENQLFPLGLKEFKVEFTSKPPATVKPVAEKVETQIKHVIAVASGKGGVGKSTVAANLALALLSLRAKVGLLDADVYGPSIPLLMQKVGAHLEMNSEGKILPIENYGLKMMSVGFLAKPGEAVVWRGPMVHKLLEEFFRKVEWGTLDYLIVDLPPGTGDIQLSLSQLISLSGSVVVTTPQDVALADVEKCVSMFKKVNIPILGIVENMSYYMCPKCGDRAEIFNHGGGEKAAQRWGYSFLGSIPLKTSIRAGGDEGTPFVFRDSQSEESKSMLNIASNLRQHFTSQKTAKV